MKKTPVTSLPRIPGVGPNAHNGFTPPPQPQYVRLYAGPHVHSAVAQIDRGRDFHHSEWVELERAGDSQGVRIFQGSIPERFAHTRHYLRVVLRDSYGSQIHTLPSDGPVTVGTQPLYITQSELFLYDPPPVVSHPRRETIHFKPANFRPRKVHVLIPRGYAENPRKTYPALYALDGQNVFHPGGPFGSWDLDHTLMRMISRAEICETFLIAVDNTEDRFAEYTPEYGNVQGVQGRGGEFLAAVRDELLPVLHRRYRITDDPHWTGLIGSSLGGLIGYHAFFDFQELFGSIAALSPSFWVNLPENLRRARRAPETGSRLWIDSGCAGPNSDGYFNTVRVRDALLKAGLQIGPKFMHVVALGHEHRERDWSQRCPDILRWMFPPFEQAPPLEPQNADLVFV